MGPPEVRAHTLAIKWVESKQRPFWKWGTGENVRFPEETGKTRVFIHRRKENAAVSPDSHLSLGEPIGPFLPRRPQREAPHRGQLLLAVVGRSRKVGAAAGNPWEGRHIKQQMGTRMEVRA